MIAAAPLGALASGASTTFPAPGPADLAARLAAATQGAPLSSGGIDVPTPEAAQAAAESALFARMTPGHLANVLDAMASGTTVDYLDVVGAGVLLHYASPELAATPLGVKAVVVVREAAKLRTDAAPRMPLTTPAALPPLPLPTPPGAPSLAPAKFGDANVLGTIDRTLRVDDLRVSTTSILDYARTVTTLRSQTVSTEFRNQFYYYYSSYYFLYSYFYNLDQVSTESSTTYDSLVTSLYQYAYQFDDWKETSGVSISLVDQSAPQPGGASAHVLFALFTPYTYIDHWWLIYTFDSLMYQLYHSETDYFANYWSEATSDYNLYGSSSETFSYQYSLGFRFTSFTRGNGYERIPVANVRLLAAPSIRFDLPLGEYNVLLRQDPLFDLTTAATVSLPGQVGVEYKDAKASEYLVTTPRLSDLDVAYSENPVVDPLLSTGDTVVLTAQGIQHDPTGFATGTVAAVQGLAAPVVADPKGYATATVASVCPSGPTVPKDCSTPSVGVAVQRPVWLEASYAADFATSWRSGGAGFGFLTLDGKFPLDGRPILVTMSGAGLGAPVGFRVKSDGADLVADPITVPGSLPPSPVPLPPPLAATSASDPQLAAVLAMPYETSFPAFLASTGIASGNVSEIDYAKAAVLRHMTPVKLAHTIAGMTTASTPENAIPYADVFEANTLIYFAGPGYATDPTFGAAARTSLQDALALLLGASTQSSPASCVSPPAVPNPTALAACETGAAKDAVNGMTSVALDRLLLTQFDGSVLSQTTAIDQGVSLSDHSSLYTSIATSTQNYAAYYESSVTYDLWYRYSQTYSSYTQSQYGSYSIVDSYQHLTSYDSWFDRYDFLNGVTTVALAIGNQTSVGGVEGAAVYTVVLPFAFSNQWYMNVLLNSYENDYLSLYGSWSSYYHYQVLNGQPSAQYLASSSQHPLGYSYYSTGFSVNGATETLAFPNEDVSSGASVTYEVPAQTYAALARTPAPFVTTGLLSGNVPYQDATDREAKMWSDDLVLSPSPNVFRIRVDDDPTVAKPLEQVGAIEEGAILAQGNANDLVDAATHDPVGTAKGVAATAQQAANDAAAAARGDALGAVATAQGLAAVIVADPVGFAKSVPGTARGATVTVPTVAVPKHFGTSVNYEVSYTSAGFGAYSPVIVFVGVLVPKDKGTVDQGAISITITGQGVEGGGALGATGPFVVTHTVDLRGADALPDTVGGQVLQPGGMLPGGI